MSKYGAKVNNGHAAAIAHEKTGDVLYYTGKAGKDYLSRNRLDAFFGYSESGALLRAQKILAQAFDGQKHAYAAAVPFEGFKSNPDAVHIDIGSHNAGGRGSKTNPTPRLDHWEQASQRAHAGPRGGLTKKPSPRLIQRRLKTHHQKMPGVWANPLVNVKVKSPAQRGKGAPDGRLIARRKVTEKAPEGFYANPLHSKRESNANAARYAELYGGAPDTIRAWKDHYIVRFHKPGEKLWTPIAVFKTLNVATTFAKEHARLHPTYTVSIVDKAE